MPGHCRSAHWPDSIGQSCVNSFCARCHLMPICSRLPCTESQIKKAKLVQATTASTASIRHILQGLKPDSVAETFLLSCRQMESDAYISEIETIGAAYEDMQVATSEWLFASKYAVH